MQRYCKKSGAWVKNLPTASEKEAKQATIEIDDNIPLVERQSMLGNRFWEARSSHGRDKIFETPEVLLAACAEYFSWCVENPLFEMRALNSKDGPQRIEISKPRAFTLNGLCIFLDIDVHTWQLYRQREAYVAVVRRVEAVIYEQKFTGAAVDLFNAGIISRDLGLTEKRETTINQNINHQITSDMTPAKAAEVWVDVLKSEAIEDHSDD